MKALLSVLHAVAIDVSSAVVDPLESSEVIVLYISK
jgi:hypothetical protein